MCFKDETRGLRSGSETPNRCVLPQPQTPPPPLPSNRPVSATNQTPPHQPLRFVVGLSALFWGPFADRYGRRRTLLIASAAFTGISIGCIFAPTIERESNNLGCNICSKQRACRGSTHPSTSLFNPNRQPPTAPPPLPPQPPSPHRVPRLPGRRSVGDDGGGQRRPGRLVGAGRARQGDGNLHDPDA